MIGPLSGVAPATLRPASLACRLKNGSVGAQIKADKKEAASLLRRFRNRRGVAMKARERNVKGVANQAGFSETF
ncbi:hypothetical protein [Brevundimonas diminuta]|uniref:hypothetical protein n=1 Tax=Brevundimonas diminuta TaxID=293 RepID=UPI003F80D6B8